MKYKKVGTKIRVIIATFLIAILFYWLNLYTPLYADDYSYSYSFATGEKILSFTQIINSQMSHYYCMNGRSITHTLAQMFLMFGDTIFNYINTISFILLIYLIYFHSFGEMKYLSASKLFFIAMLLFLITPAFGQSYLWITGAANYLYGILLILVFLIPYRIQINKHYNNLYSIWIEVLLGLMYGIAAIVAGWTNENTAVAMCVIMISYISYFFIMKLRIHIWNFTGLIGGITGLIIMLTSPGNASRLANAGGSGGIIEWLKRMVFYTCDMVTYLHMGIIIIMILLYCYAAEQHNNSKTESTTHYNNVNLTKCILPLIYLLGFTVSIYSMIVSPSFPARVYSGPVVFLLITIGSIDSMVDWSKKNIKIVKLFVMSFLIFLSASTYVKAFYELKNIDISYQQRVTTINKAVSKHEDYVEIPNICGNSGYSCYGPRGDLSFDSNEWPNTAIARYYNIDKVKCLTRVE